MAQAMDSVVSYFPGCSAHGTGVEYDQSTREVCAALGVGLKDLEDWNCCGATSAHAIDADLSLALSARNLAMADALGLDELVTGCAACFNRLRHAAAHIDEHGTPLGMAEVEGKADVIHLLELLSRPAMLDRLEKLRFNELHRLKVVPYYGCLIVRPPEVTGAKDPENPTSMDEILERMQITVKRWPHKTRCCGTSLAMTRTDLVQKLSTELVEMADRAGAEAIVAACPLCFVNLDTRQTSALQLPIFYFTELMALFIDADGARSNLKRHQVSPLAMLKSKGIY